MQRPVLLCPYRQRALQTTVWRLSAAPHRQHADRLWEKKTDRVIFNRASMESMITLSSCTDECMGTALTQGDHEGWVEQTQICPVCVIHYSPCKERKSI